MSSQVCMTVVYKIKNQHGDLIELALTKPAVLRILTYSQRNFVPFEQRLSKRNAAFIKYWSSSLFECKNLKFPIYLAWFRQNGEGVLEDSSTKSINGQNEVSIEDLEIRDLQRIIKSLE